MAGADGGVANGQADSFQRRLSTALTEVSRLLKTSWLMEDVEPALREAEHHAGDPIETFGVFSHLASLLRRLQQFQASGKRWADLLDAAQIKLGDRQPDERHVADTIARVLRDQRAEIDRLKEAAKHNPLTAPLSAFWKAAGEELAKKLINPRDRGDFFDAMAATHGDFLAALGTVPSVPGEKKAPELYREHTPAQLTVDQAHQALTRHGVPMGVNPRLTLVQRIECLAGIAESNNNTLFGSMVENGAEIEKLRGQLAACGVLARSNTRESLAKHRVMHPDYECDAVRNVIDAVEREIDLRERRDADRNKVAKAIATLQEGA